MALKPFEFLSNAVRAKEIVTVLARNGFADLLQKLDLPPRLMKAFGSQVPQKRSQWERLRMVMEQLGPTFVKVGQLLSMRPDLVPEALIVELKKLQETVPPVSFDSIRPIVEEELGQSLDSIFTHFEEEAVGAASMAQVHRAVLVANGRRVAVKVQRPNLQKVIDADFDILSWFAKQAHDRVEDLQPLNLPDVIEALRESLERELDFRREAKSLAFFELRNAHPKEIAAPKVFSEYCTRRVLVMEWIEGRKLSDIEPNSDEAKRIARVGSRSLFHQILMNGFFHADPHAGNVRVMPDGRVCLLDWGMTGQLTERMRFGLVDLFVAFVKGDPEQVTRLAISLEDTGESIDRRRMERDVNLAIREHYNPDTGEGDVGRAVLKLLYVFGQNGVDLARDYSLMAKAILCVEETGTYLDETYNIKTEFEPVLTELIRKRRNPKRMIRDFRDSVLFGIDQLQNVPEEALRILKKIEKDNLKINLQHKGLEDLDDAISDASNKITLGIIIGCLLVGSSLIVTSNTPPIVFGFPILGIAGFVLSFLLGLYVAFDILRGPPRQ
ncbi:AarF/UbiB family protein [Pelagicoccus sp. SDUM812003]|uniref:ABC1 kinase family protein n=1 Tax=Pelagicoccus sp. SDUM812003 TaxID=3041267 RepID=UPI00281049C5|nr:AarF/UbiB family protein [Pelagicoccus sp. SDUM812003]MDQ8201727.1 AarF/UbiB family protein [Pelagicoccus sp. SDUM812003]